MQFSVAPLKRATIARISPTGENRKVKLKYFYRLSAILFKEVATLSCKNHNSCKILTRILVRSCKNAVLESNSCKYLAIFTLFCSKCYKKCKNLKNLSQKLHFLPQKICENFLRKNAISQNYQNLVRNVQHCNKFAKFAIFVRSSKKLSQQDL